MVSMGPVSLGLVAFVVRTCPIPDDPSRSIYTMARHSLVDDHAVSVLFWASSNHGYIPLVNNTLDVGTQHEEKSDCSLQHQPGQIETNVG